MLESLIGNGEVQSALGSRGCPRGLESVPGAPADAGDRRQTVIQGQAVLFFPRNSWLRREITS